MTIRLYAPWVHSLKEKRREIKRLLACMITKFHVSAVEAEHQDVHQTIVLGVAIAAGDRAQADSIMDHILTCMETATQAEITDVQREILF